VPSSVLPPVSISDKVEHAVAYAALGLLGGMSAERTIWRTILGLAAFGLLLELLQTFSPGRSPDALDAAADIIGACVGVGAASAVLIAIDKITGGATRCRACVAGGDVSHASCAPAATSPSRHKRASCVSN
jgi:hypothetical protein